VEALARAVLPEAAAARVLLRIRRPIREARQGAALILRAWAIRASIRTLAPPTIRTARTTREVKIAHPVAAEGKNPGPTGGECAASVGKDTCVERHDLPPSRVEDSCRQRLWSVTTSHSAPSMSNKLIPKVPVTWKTAMSFAEWFSGAKKRQGDYFRTLRRDRGYCGKIRQLHSRVETSQQTSPSAYSFSTRILNL
jgi:hypothetical protein